MTGCLRIAFATGHYRPFFGGIESHVEHIARRLVERGHRVEVLTQWDDPSWPATEEIDGVVVRRHRPIVRSRHMAVSAGLAVAVRRLDHSYDVVHSHGYHSSVPLLAATSRRPIVFTPHYHGTGHGALRKLIHPPYRILGRRIIERAAAVVCVSRAEASLLCRHFPQVERKLLIIPNGVDMALIRSVPPRRCSGRVIMSAGRLESYKQVHIMVEAMAHLPDDHWLRVTGDGPERTRLEQLACNKGLSSRVTFLGRVGIEDLYSWFRRADAYVSMSGNEAMPVTILELLACGARVVASDIPAHRDIAEQTGGSIRLVPLDATPRQLAAAISSAIAAPPVVPRVSDWQEVTDRTLEVYRRVLDYV